VNTVLITLFLAVTAPQAVYLDSLDLSHAEQWVKTPQAGRSLDAGPLTLDGVAYDHGVGTSSFSEIAVELEQSAIRFEAVAGVDDETGGKGSAAFEIWLDGRKVAETGVVRGGDKPQRISADISGGQIMLLLVSDAGDGIANDHADWADAKLILAPDAAGSPKTVPVPKDATVPELASGFPAEPAVNWPRVTGATPGRPFLFKIPATGQPPLTYMARNLPPGLALDAATGIIAGVLESEGETEVAVTVTNARGAAKAAIKIVGGKDKLALTPPMGWNSWNAFGIVVDDAKVRAAADALVDSGLAAQGYRYVNIDDSWNDRRGPDGRLTGNKRFPDMRALADYVHSKGLKIGIYSSPGPKTCQGYEGSYQHEIIDARTFAEWGFDYLKYDWCGYFNILDEKTASREEMQHPFRVMRDALDAAPRDIVYSLCQYGMANVWEWGRDVGANLWRTTTDIDDTWAGMSNIGFNQDDKRPFAGPGGWNDPDMLVVGQVGWGPSLRATRLTKHEQVTHLTLWSLLAAPLLIGCDLEQLDAFTRDLLGNPEVIAVNQDPLGKQAVRISRNGFEEIWQKPLADGGRAVGIFNRRPVEAEVAFDPAELGLEKPRQFRNLWTRKNIEPKESFTVPAHGAILFKLSGSAAVASP